MSSIEKLYLTGQNRLKLNDLCTLLSQDKDITQALSTCKSVHESISNLLIVNNVAENILGMQYEYDDETKYNYLFEWTPIKRIIKETRKLLLEKQTIQNTFNHKKRIGCFAPHIALNFAQSGCIGACCYTSRSPGPGQLGFYPDKTIKEIWTGKNLQRLRDHLDELKFGISDACKKCLERVHKGDYENSLIAKYDKKIYDLYLRSNRHKTSRKPGALVDSKMLTDFYEQHEYPLILEFELSNICNYECLMCGGDYSSQIRKNVEKKPPVISPYDSAFVEQLVEFIPHAMQFEFLGGEPFLVPIYYEIWDKIAELNSGARIGITTNGSILNDKVKTLLTRLKNLHIVVSLDSVNPETYSLIRKHGHLDKVVSNIDWFKTVTNDISIAVCPMVQNIFEMHDIMEFCIKRKLKVYFNEVGGSLKSLSNSEYGLPEVALSFLNEQQKADAIKYLCSKNYKTRSLSHHQALTGLIANLINS